MDHEFRRDSASALLVPTMVERTAWGERAFDLFSRLLQSRIVVLSSPIDDQVAAQAKGGVNGR